MKIKVTSSQHQTEADNLHTNPPLGPSPQLQQQIFLHNYSALFTLFSSCLACYLSITILTSNSSSLLPSSPKVVLVWPG